MNIATNLINFLSIRNLWNSWCWTKVFPVFRFSFETFNWNIFFQLFHYDWNIFFQLFFLVWETYFIFICLDCIYFILIKFWAVFGLQQYWEGVSEFSIYFLPYRCITFPIFNITHQNGTIFFFKKTKDKPGLTNHNHSKSIVYL